jgi:hypothetical protein
MIIGPPLKFHDQRDILDAKRQVFLRKGPRAGFSMAFDQHNPFGSEALWATTENRIPRARPDIAALRPSPMGACRAGRFLAVAAPCGAHGCVPGNLGRACRRGTSSLGQQPWGDSALAVCPRSTMKWSNGDTRRLPHRSYMGGGRRYLKTVLSEVLLRGSCAANRMLRPPGRR